jgi:hypothetical protein
VAHGTRGIEQCFNARHTWRDFFEQLKRLADEQESWAGKTCKIAARSGEVWYDALFKRISDTGKDDWYGLGLALQGQHGNRRASQYSGCCARATTGHTVALPSAAMNTRRFIRSPRRR